MIRTHVAISLDGFAAFPDGEPAWDAMPTFRQGTHGTDQLEQCDAVLMGRTSFDQGFEHWLSNWPYPGKKVYVLTSSPLPENAGAMGVVASAGGPQETVEQLRDARDVHLLGGPRAIRAFLALGAIDRLGIVILPVLFEKGIPLFPAEATSFSQPAARSLRLESQRSFPDGAVELVYAP